jgi:hypothetical protein
MMYYIASLESGFNIINFVNEKYLTEVIKLRKIKNISVAEPADENMVITEVQEALDLMGDSAFNGCNRIILTEKNLHPDFFRLHTGIAGEILQKFSTYDFKLAIIGDFTKYKSKNLQDFIRESNKGRRIFFVNSMEEALNKITIL